jgi:hypothetical protein
LSALRGIGVANCIESTPDLDTLATRVQGAAMGTYVAATYPSGYEYPISTLFWGAMIILALFVSCLLAGKAIEWVRDRRNSDAVVVDAGNPEDPWDKAITRPSADYFVDGWSGLGTMSQREQEELFSIYAPRKVRKAMRARRKAREQAQKKQNKY